MSTLWRILCVVAHDLWWCTKEFLKGLLLLAAMLGLVYAIIQYEIIGYVILGLLTTMLSILCLGILIFWMLSVAERASTNRRRGR